MSLPYDDNPNYRGSLAWVEEKWDDGYCEMFLNNGSAKEFEELCEYLTKSKLDAAGIPPRSQRHR